MNKRLSQFPSVSEQLSTVGVQPSALSFQTPAVSSQQPAANSKRSAISTTNPPTRQSAISVQQSTISNSPTGDLANYPPVEQWDDWQEYDSKAWPERKKHSYMLVPTVCFNCESACGLWVCGQRPDWRSSGQPTAPRQRRNALRPGHA
jgi:hypothetical protein